MRNNIKMILFLIVSLGLLPAQNVKKIYSIQQLYDIYKNYDYSEQIDGLILYNLNLNYNLPPELRSPNTNETTKLGLSMIELQDISGQTISDNITDFISFIADSNLKTLRLTNVGYKSDFAFKDTSLFAHLEKLQIHKTELDEYFFKYFDAGFMPKLRHLELVDCKLDDDAVIYLKNSGLMEQIEFLDLSQNEFENTIFSIFPSEKESNLKTLKLNRCSISIEEDDYEPDYKAVSKRVKNAKYFVDWGKPYFKNLAHLELQDDEYDIDLIISLLSDTVLQKLKVFYPFILKEDKNLYKKISWDKNLEKFYQAISDFPLQSVRNNYNFKTPSQLNIFCGSKQAAITENLILEGERWNYWAVKTFLSSEKLPALKELSLLNTSMEQNQVKKIIDEFKHICVNAIIVEQGEDWPQLEKKRKF